MKTNTSVRPSPKHFRIPLLKVLGRAVKFQPEVFVLHKDLVPKVIRAAGFDPDNLGSYGPIDEGWRRKGRNPAGFDRNVSLAFRYAYRNCQEPLTVKGTNPGMWGLTEAGVALAKKMCKRQRPQKNATARFLDKRLCETGGINGTLWNLLRGTLAKRLSLSAKVGFLDDHIQNCWLKLIRLDALKSRIEDGVNISDSHLATYVMRTACTDVRDMATEPVCRELYGARTEKERQTGTMISHASDQQVCWDTSGDTTVVMDIVDTDASMDERLQFEQLWSEVEQSIRDKKPKAGGRYAGIMHALYNGMTVKEIARQENVSPYRAAGMVAEARRCAREAAEEGAVETYRD